jgi:hypothetical protein
MRLVSARLAQMRQSPGFARPLSSERWHGPMAAAAQLPVSAAAYAQTTVQQAP